MWPLSTPVSYVTDAFIREPFNRGGSDPLSPLALFLGNHVVMNQTAPNKDHPLYIYLALPNDELIAFFAPLLLGLIQQYGINVNVQQDTGPLVRKRWFMVSPGPDGYFTFDQCTLSPVELCIFREIADAAIDSTGGIYDPTNGTVSVGELVRTGEGISMAK